MGLIPIHLLLVELSGCSLRYHVLAESKNYQQIKVSNMLEIIPSFSTVNMTYSYSYKKEDPNADYRGEARAFQMTEQQRVNVQQAYWIVRQLEQGQDPKTLRKLKNKVPILYCFSSISHSCQRSNSTVFDMYCPNPSVGPEFQLWANELHLSTPTWRALPYGLACYTSLSGRWCLFFFLFFNALFKLITLHEQWQTHIKNIIILHFKVNSHLP